MKHKPEKNISPGFERAVTLKLLLITGHMKAARHSHGNWVEGDRFWDREKDIELMTKKRDDGRTFFWLPRDGWVRPAEGN